MCNINVNGQTIIIAIRNVYKIWILIASIGSFILHICTIGYNLVVKMLIDLFHLLRITTIIMYIHDLAIYSVYCNMQKIGWPLSGLI